MQSQDLQGFVSVAVAGLAELLRTYGKFIRAMIQLSQTDSVIAAHGRRVYADHERRFRACLLRCRRAGWQGEVDDAAVFCFRVIYDVVGAQLGFRQGARIEESQWSVMVDSLTSMMFVYLSAVRSE